MSNFFNKYLIGIMATLVIALILLTRYSFTLKADLKVVTGNYDDLIAYSIKQANQLEAERASYADLNIAYKKLDRKYETSKKHVALLPEVNGCLAESDVSNVLCGAGIFKGTSCPDLTNPPGADSTGG